MNYLHAPYIAAGSISQDDLLYTASVFMTEPVRWVERYEWRSTSEYEKCAIGVFWREMMDSMMIDYQSRLSGGSFSTKDKKEWKDGIEFWDDVADWARKYEEKYMVPAQSNKKTGDATASMLLDVVPEGLKEAAMKVIAVVMEPRLRRSMMYADPPESYVSTISTIFSIRRFVLRYLVLPRPEFMRARILTEPDKKTGRLRYTHYKDRPYYVQPTFWNRWGPEALMWRLMGGVVPGGKDGEKYMPQGYLFEEIGPRRVVGRGKETTDKFEENIRMVRKGGCPFPH